MQKIALVMPYYGKLPVYLNYWLRSLQGKMLDVLFFSDLDVKEYPENFYPIKMTFVEFKKLAKEKLGVPVRIDSPRRLCDFKPMYGKIFEDCLSNYDYWAFGDCDLVYGNKLNDEIADALKTNCDVFSGDAFFCSGPFCMIRNRPELNNLYRKADNWRSVVASAGDDCLAFDELCGFWHFQLRRGEMTIEDCRCHMDSFSAVVMREPGLRLHFKTILYQEDLSRGEVVRMIPDGRLYADKEGIAVYHWVRAKMKRCFTYTKVPYKGVQGYRICKTGFYNDGWQWHCHAPISIFRLIRAKCVGAIHKLNKL